jgi:hypothetical protein
MTCRYSCLPKLAGILSLLFALPLAYAQRPEWKPIAELLVGSIGESDPVRMSDVMTRCTALNMLFAGLSRDLAPDMVQHYQNEAQTLIEQGVVLESNMVKQRTGEAADISALTVTMQERVKGMVRGYNDWFDANKVSDGFYITKDIELEMDSCKLASRFVHQL